MRRVNWRVSSALAMAYVCVSSAIAAPTGMLYEYIQPTNPFEAFFMPLIPDDDTHGPGWSASPKIEGNEMADALREFADLGAALETIEALKRKDGFEGGKLFGTFTYDEKGQLDISCGLSSSSSTNLEEIRQKATRYGNMGPGGDFRNFKLASRAERVRILARCISTFPGMPPLKPTKPELKGVDIDKTTYNMAEKWLKSRGFIGTAGQYRNAFLCLVAQTARALPDVVGDTVIVRTSLSRDVETVKHGKGPFEPDRRETVHIETPLSELIVVSSQAAAKLRKLKIPEDFSGPWPGTLGFASDAVEELVKPGLKDLDYCRQWAGLMRANAPLTLRQLSSESACVASTHP